jgi:hypothetical protein
LDRKAVDRLWRRAGIGLMGVTVTPEIPGQLTSGAISFRRAYIASVVDRVEVDDHAISS